MTPSQEGVISFYIMIKAILFTLAVTFPVMVSSNSLSLNSQQKSGKKLMFLLMMAVIQAVMWILGKLLGSTFMHLISDYARYVPFVLCLLIAFRMFMDTIKIKKGGNVFVIDNVKELTFLSIASGINVFFVGLVYEYLTLFGGVTPLVIALMSFIWGIVGAFIPFSNIKLLTNSLLNLVFSILICVIGIVALF